MTLNSQSYLKRALAVALQSPAEFYDRLVGQIEIKREMHLPRPDLNKHESHIGCIEALFDAKIIPAIKNEFDEIWNAVSLTLSSSEHALGKGYDAGRALAEVAYYLTRLRRPRVVIETGVARGITSRVVLEALEKNCDGHLFSIDLPPLHSGWFAESASAITPELQHRWTYIRGASRRYLPGLLTRLGAIPMFIHDSLHTYSNMQWELQQAWSVLTPHGVLLCDDIEDNFAFFDFTRSQNAQHLIIKEPFRSGFIGVIKR